LPWVFKGRRHHVAHLLCMPQCVRVIFT
jgi:hypothetical protein